MIQSVDNYLSNFNDTEKYYFKFEGEVKRIKNDKIIISEKIDVLLNNYQSKSPNNTFFSFFKDKEKTKSKKEDDLIISIKKDGDNYIAQTGNYVGKFKWQGLEIDIKSRFSNTFLERMLNFANDIFLDDASITGKDSKNDLDISKYIIYYMFVQDLEKAFLLGLPKSYRSVEHHEMKLKGKIDINKFIKYDIPFQGKISSVSREQKEIQEIIDVLYKAIKIIDKNKFNTKNISHIKTHLKEYKSNNYVSNEMINKALKSKALQNPIFAPYKKVLEYARFIINGNNIEEKSDGKQETFGFIINVAELFEIYMTKLLQKEFSEWMIESPKIELYDTPKMFYQRKIIPDIVMIKDNDVIVFDTKYKKMLMRGTKENIWDVDRNDFFQINTYMSYYQNHYNKYNVKIGGLLFPIEKSFKENKNICHSDIWFGNPATKFIVDGIDLSNLEEAKDDENKFAPISKREQKFIQGIKKLLN